MKFNNAALEGKTITTVKLRDEDRELLKELGSGYISRGIKMIIDATRSDIKKEINKRKSKK
jgi:hypothetical protein